MQRDLFSNDTHLRDSREGHNNVLPEELVPWLILDSNFISLENAQKLFSSLQSEIAWQQPEVKVFGKVHAIPRLQGWMADSGVSYQYSGLTLGEAPWHEQVSQLRQQINEEHKTDFNSALLNYYRNGDDKMGWHADDERELGYEPTVAIVSLGQVRTLKVRNNTTKVVTDVQLESGSLLVMKPGFQSHFQHQIPVRKKINEGRISLTFRKIIN